MQLRCILVFSILVFAFGTVYEADAESGMQMIDEVQFMLPEGWKLERDPQPGIKARAEKGERQFLYQGKLPNNFVLTGDTAKNSRKAIHDFAVLARRSFERTFQLDLILEEYGALDINGLEAINIVFEFSSDEGKNGFVRMVMLLTPKAAYGFVGLSAVGNNAEEKSTLNQLFQSIKIDLEKATGLDPMDDRQMLQLVKETVSPALAGMPHGWNWTLMGLDTRKEGNTKVIEAVIQLDKPDTPALLDCVKEIMETIKLKGRDPYNHEIPCKENTDLMPFLRQFSIMVGVFMSPLLGSNAGNIQDACLTIQGAGGSRGKTVRLKISRFMEFMKIQDGVAFAKAVDWQ